MTAASAGPRMPKLGQAEPASSVRAPVRTICCAAVSTSAKPGCLHVAGAAQHGGERVGDPMGKAAGNRMEANASAPSSAPSAAAQRAIDDSAEADEDDSE